MSSRKIKNRFCCVLLAGLILVTALSLTAAVHTASGDTAWREKIDADLWEVMEGKSEEDLIPVYLWREGVEEGKREKEASLKSKQSAANKVFLETYVIDKSRKVLYNGVYTGTLIIEATVKEIEYYAKIPEVHEISLYEDLKIQSYG